LEALSFLDGVVKAEAAIPSGVSILLLCPRYYGVGSDVMVEQGGCVVQGYAQMVFCVYDRWKIVYPMLGLRMEADSFDFLSRRCSRAGVSVLEFNRVSEDMLPRFDSAVTQHTTACCSMQVVDITLAKQASTNITSLKMVQQKHCGPKYKVIHIYYIPKRDDTEMLPIKRTLLVLGVYNN
jgi:hypothetical protein